MEIKNNPELLQHFCLAIMEFQYFQLTFRTFQHLIKGGSHSSVICRYSNMLIKCSFDHSFDRKQPEMTGKSFFDNCFT